MNLAEIRQKYPQYEDLSDADLADGLYRKFYADMDRAEFDAKVGLAPAAEPVAEAAASAGPAATRPVPIDRFSPGTLAPAPRIDPVTPTGLPADRTQDYRMDTSTAAGDVEAGLLTLQQVPPGLQALAGAGGATLRQRGIEGLQERVFERERALDAYRGLIEGFGGVAETDPDFIAERQAVENLRAELPGRVERNVASLERNVGRLTEGGREIAELQSRIDDIPVNPAAQDVFGAETFGEGRQAFLQDPLGVLRTVVLRSLPASAPGIVGGVAGMAGGPAGAAAGAGAGEFATEAGLSAAQGLQEALAERGIDPNDQDALRALAQSDPDALGAIVSDALSRAAIISAAGAATGGISGTIARSARTARQRLTGGAATTFGVEPAGEAAGEALAGGAPGEVLAEALGGAGQGAVQYGGQVAVEALRGATQPPPQTPQATPQPPAPPVSPPPVLPQPSPEPDARPQTVPPSPPAAPPQPEPPAPTEAERPAEAVAPAEVETVYTPDNEPVQVQRTVVEADEVRASSDEGYAGVQPRDRTRAASEAQIEGIANRPIPERLDRSPETDRGAPIVDPTGNVESGNARTMALRRAYERGTADAYRAYVEQNFPEAVGMRNPIIVRRRVSDVDEQRFATSSNTPATLAMSATEEAQSDAALMQDDVLGLYRGGDPLQARNRDMVRAWLAKLPQTEQGAFLTGEGGVSIEGQRRFQKALFQRAYDDAEMLRRMAEATDDDIRSLTGAMIEVAPAMADVRNRVERGELSPDGDYSADLRRAAEFIRDMRQRDLTLADARSQIDAFADPISPEADAIVGILYDGEKGRLRSKAAITRFLQNLADAARADRIDQTEMAGAERPRQTREETIREAGRRAVGDDADPQAGLFEAPADGGGRDRGGPADEGRGDGARRAEAAQADEGLTDDAEADTGAPDAAVEGERRPAEPEGVAGREAPDRGQDAQGPRARPARPDAAGTGRGDREGGQVADAGGSTGRRPRGRLSPRFKDFSQSNRPSIFRQAYIDAGMNPQSAQNRPLAEQIDVLSKALERKYGIKVEVPTRTVRRKNVAGRAVEIERTQISEREAVDQLLDAYHQVGVLAHLMGMPPGAMALQQNGAGFTLSLEGRLQGALGAFAWGPQGRKILLPGRSNSFAHEWAHALDHWLAQRFNSPKAMLTRKMDDPGLVPPASPHRAVADSFARLMQSLYGETAQLNAMILSLQIQGMKLGADGRPTPDATEARRVLNNMRMGKRPPPAYLNRYFQTSKEFDDQWGGGGYFTDPAEMFARAFEAWVGRTVGLMTDDPQSLLSKGEWAYLSDADERLAKTFPKGTDFAAISEAFRDLVGAMARTHIHGAAPAQQAMIDPDKVDLRKLGRWRSEEGLAAGEKRRMRDAMDAAKRVMSPSANRPAAERAARIGFNVYNWALTSAGAAMHTVAKRQPTPEARKALTNIADMLAKDPGSGRQAQATVFEEEANRTTRRRTNQVEGVLINEMGHGAKLTDRDHRALLAFLTGTSEKVGREAALKTGVDVKRATGLQKVAKGWRQALDETWYDLRGAGVNVAYTQGYLPRRYLIDKIEENTAGFMEAAKKTYAVMFDRDVTGQEDAELQHRDMKAIMAQLRNYTRPTTEGERVPESRVSDEDEALWQSYLDARTKSRRAAKAAEDDPTSQAKADKAAELQKEYEARLEDALTMLSDRFSESAARDWRIRMTVGNITDYDAMGPETSFLKGRNLPPEADDLLRDFMSDNALDTIHSYLHAASRRAAYAKRFGAQNETLQNMLDAAAEAGASQDDLNFFKTAVNHATGNVRHNSWGQQWITAASTAVYLYGTIRLLTKAAWSSIAEPVVAGLRTGDVRDGFSAFVNTVSLLRKGRREEMYEFARAMGVITSSMQDSIMQSRVGADTVNMSETSRRLLGKYFDITLLSPLTNAQRVGQMRTMHHVLVRWLTRNQTEGRRKAFADRELNELGIAPEDRGPLLEWLQGLDGPPQIDDLMMPDGGFTPAGRMYADAVSRLIEETIQEPLKTDRPLAASDPMTAGLYGIQSFIWGFHRNILRRTLRRGQEEGDSSAVMLGKASVNAAYAMPAVATLAFAHFGVTVLREALWNPEQWDEKEEEGELVDWLIGRTVSRMGITGAYDPIFQAFTGIRYERDLSNLLISPYLSAGFRDFQQVLKVVDDRNSANTNTAEYNAARAIYLGVIQPAALYAVTEMAPTGPISRLGSAAAVWTIGSYRAGDSFASTLVGQKGERHRGTKWWEMGKPKE